MSFLFRFSEKDKKWSRENLDKYIEDDRLKWKFADKNEDKNLTREEFEYFHHPREHEAMSEYIAVVCSYDSSYSIIKSLRLDGTLLTSCIKSLDLIKLQLVFENQTCIKIDVCTIVASYYYYSALPIL